MHVEHAGIGLRIGRHHGPVVLLLRDTGGGRPGQQQQRQDGARDILETSST
jgi:hypothetical protein